MRRNSSASAGSETPGILLFESSQASKDPDIVFSGGNADNNDTPDKTESDEPAAKELKNKQSLFKKNPIFLLVSLSAAAIAQGMLVSGLIPVSLTTLEKRFHLSSTQVGLFTSMYDIAVCLALLPICHFGAKGHKGRWLGTGMILLGFGAFICTLPHFLADQYEGYTTDALNICPDAGNDCSKSVQSYDRRFYALLLIGQFLNGLGGAPVYTLGVTYLDENVPQNSSPFFMGIFLACSVFGPALGFVLGGLLLGVYGDIDKSDPSRATITSDSPNWYGAWWVAYLLVAAMSFASSVPLLLLPHSDNFLDKEQLSSSAEQEKMDANVKSTYQSMESSLKGNIAYFIVVLKALCTNRTFLLLLLVDCLEALADTGAIAFLPKIVQQYFSLPANNASLLAGAVAIPAAVAGNVLGGYFMRKYNVKCAGMILFAFCVNFPCALLMSSFLAACEQPDFAGVTVPYSASESGLRLEAVCNQNCSCSTSAYEPVCLDASAFQLSYFSPCFAGCRDKLSSDAYTNCTCAGSTAFVPELTKDLCVVKDCHMLPVFLTFFGLLVLMSFLTSIPIQQAELRCVQFEHRTIAFGVRSLCFRMLGSIPGPIMFGYIVDQNCLLWKINCGHAEDCLLYNNQSLSRIIAGMGIGVKIIIIATLFLAWRCYNMRTSSIKPADPVTETSVAEEASSN